MLQDGCVHRLSSSDIEHSSAAPVANRLGEPSAGENVAPGVVVHRRARHVPVVVVRESLRLHQDRLAALGITGHIGVLNRSAVMLCGDGFRDEGDDVVAAPAEILLQFGSVSGPSAIEARRAIVAAVSCSRGVAAHEAQVALLRYYGAAETAACIEEEFPIPIACQR